MVSDYDKADVILVGLHTNGDAGKCGNEMIDMLSVVFDKNKESEKKQKQQKPRQKHRNINLLMNLEKWALQKKESQKS